MKNILTFIILCAFVSIGNLHAQSYKIITNSSNSVSSLSKKEVSDLLLKKKTKWTDGSSVYPVDLSSGSKVRESFSQDIHGKPTSAIRNFWQQAAFSGTASAPPEKNSDEEVIDYVKKTSGAIGYISSATKTSDVKNIIIN
jgi:ABC-type phosphate transport system substrate-binding protein